MGQGRRLRLQHAGDGRPDPQHLLRLSALRRPRAVQGRELPGTLRGHLGHGHHAVLHRHGSCAIQGRHGGQAEEVHPRRQLPNPVLRLRQLPVPHSQHPEARAAGPLHAGRDQALRLAGGPGVPWGLAPVQLAPEPGGRELHVRGGA